MLSTTHFLGTSHSFLLKYLVLFNVDANFYSLLRSLLTRIPCLPMSQEVFICTSERASKCHSWGGPGEALLPTFSISKKLTSLGLTYLIDFVPLLVTMLL